MLAAWSAHCCCGWLGVTVTLAECCALVDSHKADACTGVRHEIVIKGELNAKSPSADIGRRPAF